MTDYEEDLSINPTILDMEWLDQPIKTMKYSKIAAQAERDRDKHKEQLDFLKAELDKEIRSNPDKYGILKITENAIFNAVASQPEYRTMHSEYLDKVFEAKVASGATWAFQDRKAALENLVKLHGQQYFAGPSVPRDLSKEWEQKQKQSKSNEKVVIKTTRRRRDS